MKSVAYKPQTFVKLKFALNFFLREKWGAEDPQYYSNCQGATKKLGLQSQHLVITPQVAFFIVDVWDTSWILQLTFLSMTDRSEFLINPNASPIIWLPFPTTTEV